MKDDATLAGPADAKPAARRAAMPDVIRGGLWMMGATSCWVFVAGITRSFSGEIHTFELVFFRSLFGAVFIAPWLMRVGIGVMFTGRIGMHFLRGLLGLGTIYLLFGALALAPLGDVSAIIATRPLLAAFGAVLILGEVATGRRWVATLVGLVGALIIIRPGASGVSLGSGLALTAVVGMAALSLVIKSLSRTEPPDTIVAWQMVVFTPISLIPALFVWTTPDWKQWILAVLMGLFGTLNQRCLTRAYAAADATAVLPFDFTRLPFAAILGFILFGEFPDLWVWVGGGVIFVCVLWMARLEARAGRRLTAG
jgi:drug/metabolite transporter (DMT)-like permease